MPKDYGPPSKPEREHLVQERKRDLPRPAPAPRPPGSAGAIIDTALVRMRAERAHERELRIHSIDKALHAREGEVKTGFSKANMPAPERSKPPKSKSRTRKERTR